MRFTTAKRMGRIDRVTIDDHGIAETALMETAGQLTARHARRHFLEDGDDSTVAVLCGKGHNGADGLVAARWLDQWGCTVHVVFAAPADECSPLTQQQRTALDKNPRVQFHTAGDALNWPGADLYLDALLGTGLAGPPRPPLDRMIHRLNRHTSPVVSVDIPSGLSGDRHIPYEPCVDADLTVTFGVPKLGMILEPGYTQVGKLIVQELTFPPEAYESEAAAYHLIAPEDARLYRPIRSETGHKGESGRVGVVAGSRQYPGAAFLCGTAASEVGAGLVSVIGPDFLPEQQGPGERDLVFPAHQSDLDGDGPLPQSLLDLLERQQALVVGPGLGTSDRARTRLLNLFEVLDAPVVIDADGLNNFSGEPEAFNACPQAVLTPHPGEASRLLSISVEDVLQKPLDTTRRLRDTTGHTVVLKTSRPVVSHPGGAFSVNVTGSPALAKAGSGDVLTGLIGGLLAQGLEPGPATCLGLYLHGAAGRHAARDLDPLAVRSEDLIDAIPESLDELHREPSPPWFPMEFESVSPRVRRWNPFLS